MLDWLDGPSTKWQTFVANRVDEIHKLQEGKNMKWSHVPGNENPADILSRGVSAKSLLNSPLWWNGPRWLLQDQASWPAFKRNSKATILELKPTPVIFAMHMQTASNIINKFSNLEKVLRVMAYTLRFIKNTKLDKNQEKQDH